MAKTTSNQTINTADDLDDDRYAYERALSLMIHHTALLWQTFGSFLLTETVLIGFLGAAIIDKKVSQNGNLIIISGSVIGLIISLLWYSTFRHNSGFYELRWAQLRRIESNLNINLAREGSRFSSGDGIPDENNKILRLPLIAQALPPRRAVPLLIVLFAIVFVLFIVTQLGWI